VWTTARVITFCNSLELAKSLLRKAYTRDAYAPILSRGISLGVRGPHPSSADRTSSPKAFQSTSKPTVRSFHSLPASGAAEFRKKQNAPEVLKVCPRDCFVISTARNATANSRDGLAEVPANLNNKE